MRERKITCVREITGERKFPIFSGAVVTYGLTFAKILNFYDFQITVDTKESHTVFCRFITKSSSDDIYYKM